MCDTTRKLKSKKPNLRNQITNYLSSIKHPRQDMKFTLVAIAALVVSSNSETIRSRATSAFIREESDQPLDGNAEMTTMGGGVTFLQMQRAHDKVLLQMEAQMLLQQQHAAFAALHPQEFLELQGWIQNRIDAAKALAKKAADAIANTAKKAADAVKNAAQEAYMMATNFRCTSTGISLCQKAVKYITEKGVTKGSEKCALMSEKVCANSVVPNAMVAICPDAIGPICLKAVVAAGGQFDDGICAAGCD